MQEILNSFFHLAPISHIILNSENKITIANSACEILLGETISTLEGTSLAGFIHEKYRDQYAIWINSDEDDSPLIVRLRLPQKSDAYVQLERRKTSDAIIIGLTKLAGSRIRISDGQFAQQREGRPNNPFDTSELRGIVVTDALYDSIIAITRTLDLEEVLDNILQNLTRAISHDAADIMLITGNIAAVVRSRGYDKRGTEDVIESLRFPLDDTPTLEQMLRTRSPIIIDDLHQNNDWIERPPQDWMRAYVGIPIQVRNDVIGFLNLVSSEVAHFKEEDLKWLNIFATQAAVAINNARVHEKSNELAVAEERQRMAREIHDTVSQMLFSASMIAESLTTDDTIKDSSTSEDLQHIFKLNRGALAEMRLLLLEYKPENLVQMELPSLLERLKQAVEGRTPIEIDLEINDGHPAPPNVRLVFYRIAQEALNNVSKHSRAKQAQVKFVSTEAYVTMEIKDHGIGFDTDTITGGFGFENMRERVASLGATLSVESTQGEGTTIRVHWLRNSSDEHDSNN